MAQKLFIGVNSQDKQVQKQVDEDDQIWTLKEKQSCLNSRMHLMAMEACFLGV